MTPGSLRCPSCEQALDDLSTDALAALTNCPRCHRPLEVTLLPAFGRDHRAGWVGANRVGSEEAACFFHETKRAEVACDQCGRFVCALCHLDLEGRNLCPTCVGSGRPTDAGGFFERERIRWDIVVGWLVWLPLLTLCFWFLWPLTLLVAVGIAVWKQGSPSSRITRSRAWMLGHLGLGLVGGAVVIVLALMS